MDRANGNLAADEASQSKVTRHISKQNKHKPEDKLGFSGKGFGFLRESDMGSDGFQSKTSKTANLSSQELILSYLCDSTKLGFLEKEFAGANLLTSLEKESFKGKEAMVSENSNKWVERDFLSLNETRLNCSKRELAEEAERESRDDKKPKLETLNLSLALPEVSFSLTASNALQNGDPPAMPRPSGSIQSLAPSHWVF